MDTTQGESKMIGTKYNKELGITEIAKLIRADIKQSVKDGKLPKGTKVSVRIQRYSGGQSLHFKVNALPGMTIENPEWIKRYQANDPTLYWGHRIKDSDIVCRYTQEASDARDLLQKLADAYNYDRSDSMTDYFDVNFYTRIDFSEELMPIR